MDKKRLTPLRPVIRTSLSATPIRTGTKRPLHRPSTLPGESQSDLDTENDQNAYYSRKLQRTLVQSSKKKVFLNQIYESSPSSNIFTQSDETIEQPQNNVESFISNTKLTKTNKIQPFSTKNSSFTHGTISINELDNESEDDHLSTSEYNPFRRDGDPIIQFDSHELSDYDYNVPASSNSEHDDNNEDVEPLTALDYLHHYFPHYQGKSTPKARTCAVCVIKTPLTISKNLVDDMTALLVHINQHLYYANTSQSTNDDMVGYCEDCEIAWHNNTLEKSQHKLHMRRHTRAESKARQLEESLSEYNLPDATTCAQVRARLLEQAHRNTATRTLTTGGACSNINKNTVFAARDLIPLEYKPSNKLSTRKRKTKLPPFKKSSHLYQAAEASKKTRQQFASANIFDFDDSEFETYTNVNINDSDGEDTANDFSLNIDQQRYHEELAQCASHHHVPHHYALQYKHNVANEHSSSEDHTVYRHVPRGMKLSKRKLYDNMEETRLHQLQFNESIKNQLAFVKVDLEHLYGAVFPHITHSEKNDTIDTDYHAEEHFPFDLDREALPIVTYQPNAIDTPAPPTHLKLLANPHKNNHHILYGNAEFDEEYDIPVTLPSSPSINDGDDFFGVGITRNL